MSAAPLPLADGDRAELAAAVALSAIDGLGPATVFACIQSCGTAFAWHALQTGRLHSAPPIERAAQRLRKREPEADARLIRDAGSIDAEAFLDQHEAAGQRVARYGTPGYPDRLLEDPAPPGVVFWHGSLRALDGPTVAIVGTRNATRLGCDTAARFAVELAERGVSVVSGLALGIDGAAHRPLVDGGHAGAPVGVIATGLDHTYPRRHQQLHHQVATSGLLLTESPIGSAPSRWRFPARNRIIAGLADAVVVIESRSAGGSMLTAAEGVARDRPVLAVPGHPTAPASAGTLDLIADGAVPVRDVTDILVAVGLGGLEPCTGPPDEPLAAALSGLAAQLLDDLGRGPSTLGELVLGRADGLDEVSAALLELERSGLVERSGAWFERSAPVPPMPARGASR